MAATTDRQRSEWLEARRRGLGSSDAPAVVGLSRWRTPLHVYLEKIGEMPDQDSSQKLWGRRLEDVVAQAYSEETGNPVYHPAQVIEWHKTLPWACCSLDRITEVDGKGRILECKTATRDSEDWGKAGTDEVPPEYIVQVQHQMAVTGFDHADLAVLIAGHDFRVYTIRRDEQLISRIFMILSDFWGKVQRREPPKVNWEHPASAGLLKKMQRIEPGKEIELDAAAVVDLLSYKEAREQAAYWEEVKAVFQAKLLERIGDAEVATLPSGHVIRRRKIERKEHMVGASSYYSFTVKEPS